MNILRTTKHLFWVAALILCAPTAWGFALLGPLANGGDSWQAGVIGYGLAYTEEESLGGPEDLGDIGGPKNIGEAYRRNAPVLYYSYDANFLDYFGSNGVVACDSAANLMNFSMTNNMLGNLDGYSAALSEFPPESLHLNYEALSLSLTDLKSVTLHLLLEQMGLAEPERFTWTLAGRELPPGGKCPGDEQYLVIQRNYADSPTALNQLQYSSYVNDTLYSYEIGEACTGPNPLAVTEPFAVDPNADEYTAVAANNADGLGLGGYYTSLTRDDVGGLRYLYASNNIVRETPAFDGITASSGVQPANLLATNVGSFTTITTSNLTTLFLFAQTNPPALVQSTFGVTVIASNLIPDVIVTNWTFTATVSSPLGAQYGTQIATVTSNAVLSFVTEFVDVFGNVITNGNLNSTQGIIQICSNTIALNYSPTTAAFFANNSVTTSGQNGGQFGSGGTLTTNTTLTPLTLNVPSGEYITLPNIPNGCGWVVQCQSIANIVATTNVIVSGTNSAGFVASQSIITFFTNHTYQVQPIICTPAPFATSLYEGIEKVQFVRADFDSLVGQFFQPVTNNYTMVMITNSQAHVVNFQRVVTQPDILFSAADDFVVTSANGPFDGTVSRTTPEFDQDNIGAGLAGPGTINSPSTFSYNKVGDAFQNSEEFTGFGTNAFASELSQIPVVQWASFDASTNDPILYPNGTSILNLQNQILVQVSPAPPALPNGTKGIPYGPITFTATGGAFNYSSVSWQVVPGLGNLPSGVILSSSGVLSGNPTQSGTFDFTVQMTDANGRTVNWFYTLIIN